MQNRNTGPVKLPKGENFWSQHLETPFLQSATKNDCKIILEFTKAIDQANVLLSSAQFNQEKFENYMKNNFAKIANLYNESINQYQPYEVREIQKKLSNLQKKMSLTKHIGQEISSILISLETKEVKQMIEIPTEEEVKQFINEFSTQIATLSKELNRLFLFSTTLDTKHGSAIFKQAKNVLKTDIEKFLQQLTLSFVKSLVTYNQFFQTTDSDQREQIANQLIKMHDSAEKLINLYNNILEEKSLYNIDNETKKKVADIVEFISRNIEIINKLGYVPPENPFGSNISGLLPKS